MFPMISLQEVSNVSPLLVGNRPTSVKMVNAWNWTRVARFAPHIIDYITPTHIIWARLIEYIWEYILIGMQFFLFWKLNNFDIFDKFLLLKIFDVFFYTGWQSQLVCSTSTRGDRVVCKWNNTWWPSIQWNVITFNQYNIYTPINDNNVGITKSWSSKNRRLVTSIWHHCDIIGWQGDDAEFTGYQGTK